MDQLKNVLKDIFSKDERILKTCLVEPNETLWKTRNYVEIEIEVKADPFSFAQLSELSAVTEAFLGVDTIINCTSLSEKDIYKSKDVLIIYDRSDDEKEYLLLAKRHLESAKYLYNEAAGGEGKSYLYDCVGIWIKTSLECAFRYFLSRQGIILEARSYGLEYLYNIADKKLNGYYLPESLRLKIKMLDGFEEGKWMIRHPSISKEELRKLIDDTGEYFKLIDEMNDEK